MKHILMPTDFSDNSWNAIQYGLSMLKYIECTFYLLTVNRIPSYSGAQTSVRANQAKLRKSILERSLADLGELLKKVEKLPPGINHKFVILADYDYFTRSIKRAVANHKIELIVMGTKGATGLQKIIVGSNTAAVISKVDCTLLAVPENAIYFDKPREIAFATDFRVAYKHNMLHTLKEVASLNNAPLRILTVMEKGGKLDNEQTSNKRWLSNYLKDFDHSFHSLSGADVGEAVEHFVECKDIGMIAMVAKNRGFLQKILIKPTVKKISYHIKIPFLVLHE